jgi:hypothetical protein
VSGAGLDLVVRARRAVVDGALRPCSIGVRAGRIAPEDSFVVDAAALRHRNPVSAYDGKRLTGAVHRTWLRGRPCPSPADSEPAGRLLRRTEW